MKLLTTLALVTSTFIKTNNANTDFSKFKLKSPLVQISNNLNNLPNNQQNNLPNSSKQKSSSFSLKPVKFQESRRKQPKPKTLSWLFLASEKNCNHDFLSHQQRTFCQKYPLLFPHIRRAAETTIRHCVNSMSKRRWDCSDLAKEVLERDVSQENLERVMPSILRRDTAEAAYLESLSSGVLSHYLSLACRRENIPYCGCGEYNPIGRGKFSTSQNFEHINDPHTIDQEMLKSIDSCSDNLAFGARFSDTFLNGALDESGNDFDSRNKLKRTTITLQLGKSSRLTARQRVLYHNTITGVNVLKRRSAETCKCVGVSGSCTQKVCWQRSPSAKEISSAIMDLYDSNSYRVRYKNRRIVARSENSKRITKSTGLSNSKASNKLSKQARKKIQEEISAKTALIYRVRDIDFCRVDTKKGIYGTQGRQCSIEDDAGEYHCSRLCCSGDWQSLTTESKKDCNCRYVWCCRIECDVCTTIETRHYCK